MSKPLMCKLAIATLLSISAVVTDPLNTLATGERTTNFTQLQQSIKDDMVDREQTFSIHYTGDISLMVRNLQSIVQKAEESDDYLHWSWKSIKYSVSYLPNDADITFNAGYYTTKSQEDYVDSQVKKIVASIVNSTMNDFEKEKAVHDWIIGNVSYDMTLQKRSAYEALTGGKVVCQGYALLADKMLTEAGITNMIIGGTLQGERHTWNLISIGGNWYHFDSTNDHVGQYSEKFFNKSDSYMNENNFVWDTSLFPKTNTQYTGTGVEPPLKMTGVTRIAGQDRFQTARAIAEKFSPGMCSNVIIASGNNFPDALSASVLAKKLGAPILLVDTGIENSSEALGYISRHLSKSGIVHIMGGTGAVSSSFDDKLNDLGYFNIDRIGGKDLYDTSALIAKKLNVSMNTPVIIASGDSFPDALSVSSVAASKGYPILLVGKNYLADSIVDFIKANQPRKVYVLGGTGAISTSVESQLKSRISGLDISRLAGQDRFETSSIITSEFCPHPKTLFIASGTNFPDALAGSVLAALQGDPIVLIDPSQINPPPSVKQYLLDGKFGTSPNIVVFGGTSAVPQRLLENCYKAVKKGKP